MLTKRQDCAAATEANATARPPLVSESASSSEGDHASLAALRVTLRDMMAARLRPLAERANELSRLVLPSLSGEPPASSKVRLEELMMVRMRLGNLLTVCFTFSGSRWKERDTHM